MKRIPLLLAALGVVSAAAYAAPELRVTSIGQEVEIEHENGSDLTTAWLYNKVGLAYGDDWTFGLEGSKQWAYDDKNDDVKGNDNRLILDAWKRINEDLKLGVRYRGHEDNQRFMARYDYSHGMFFSTGDFWYQVNEADKKADTLRAEWFPIGVKIGPVTAKYLVDYTKMVGGISEGEQKSEVEHQLRITAPLYKWDRLSLSTEARITLHHEKEFNGTEGYQAYEDFGRNRLYIKANYAVSENLGVYAQYAYELREREARDGGDGKSINNADDQIFVFGWSYTF
ncbi:hypothetical protein [uncultured Fusobacterium sp.]|uniref:hypothetical protein n=1 Tax=uncultured Fusobacterium sp. TaxID=159267 RepID=UPI0015A699D8|nr:hypothetical protein [uncultured Fusobacterium sp.]